VCQTLESPKTPSEGVKTPSQGVKIKKISGGACPQTPPGGCCPLAQFLNISSNQTFPPPPPPEKKSCMKPCVSYLPASKQAASWWRESEFAVITS